jgi:hypothetical protein
MWSQGRLWNLMVGKIAIDLRKPRLLVSPTYRTLGASWGKMTSASGALVPKGSRPQVFVMATCS